jgi:hypothetical protein
MHTKKPASARPTGDHNAPTNFVTADSCMLRKLQRRRSWVMARWSVLACAVAACTSTAPEAGIPARIRLLTDRQYVNVVRDLLGDVDVPTLQTPGTLPHQLVHDAEVVAVDASLLVQYRVAAETVARQVAADLGAFACAGGEPACTRAAIERFASRGFRRPLDDDERAELHAIYALGADGSDHAGGIALVVEAVLQAPPLLYRTEIGGDPDPAGVARLTPFELASAVSFLLYDSLPDDPLWNAAADGTLADPDVLATHVERVLATPRARTHLERVVLDWLDVHRVFDADKDPLLFPDIDDDLRASMFDETRAFVSDVLWSRRGSLRELLVSSRSFADDRLAAHYGPYRRRAGILTHASVLTGLATARSESIIQRGLYVNQRFLCTEDLGRPPFDAIAAVAGSTFRMTEYQFASYRAAHVYCSTCHRTIDPPGLALHNFDGVGRWRDLVDGQPIDPVATLAIGDAAPRTIDGPAELATALAGSEHVAACVVDQIAHHAFGRAVDGGDLELSRRQLHDRFEAVDRDLIDVFRAITTTPAFRERRREVSP